MSLSLWAEINHGVGCSSLHQVPLFVFTIIINGQPLKYEKHLKACPEDILFVISRLYSVCRKWNVSIMIKDYQYLSI